MSRSVTLNLLASALTILAAIALLSASAFVGDGPLAAPDRAQRETAVWRFYDAVNEVLRTGDAAALDRVIAPDLVVHPAPARSGRAGLANAVIALRASAPGLQLQAEEVASGVPTVARVSVVPDGAGVFLGLPLAAAPPVWADVDVFRVLDGRIAQLWGGPARPFLETLGRLPAPAPSAGGQALSLERYAAGVGQTLSAGPYVDPRLIAVVDGAISITIDHHPSQFPPVARRSSPGDGAIHLTRGDTISIPAGSRYTLRGSGANSEVVAYAVAIPQTTYNGPLQPQGQLSPETGQGHGAGFHTVLVSLRSTLPPDLLQNAVVSFGRATLQPGESIALRLEAGVLFAVPESESIVLQSDGLAPALDLLQPGEAGVVMTEATVAMFNPGGTPAVVMLVTLLPADQTREPAS